MRARSPHRPSTPTAGRLAARTALFAATTALFAARTALFAAFASVLACGPTPEDVAPRPADFAAPTSVRATLVLEPTALAIGEVARAELAVAMPQGYRLKPVAPLKLPGLWLLGVRTLPLEVEAMRVTHRTEFRVRPRELGAHEWPAMTLSVEAPDGSVETLEVPPRTFEVTSVRERFSARDEPFGLEQPDGAEETEGIGLGFLESFLESFVGSFVGSFGGSFASGFALAASLALCALALARARTRRRDMRNARPPAQHDAPPELREWAERELRAVLGLVERDPHGAATAGARLLRLYVSSRLRGGAASPGGGRLGALGGIVAKTTEELEARAPALALRSSWPELIRLLHHFDDARFRAEADTYAEAYSEAHSETHAETHAEARAAAQRERVRHALEDALRFVATSMSDSGARAAPGGRDASRPR